MSNLFKINTIEEAIADIKAGKVIIVVDDEDRENEGDFICAAECVTPEIINFMATHGRGLICTPIEEQRAEELGLRMMVSDNTSFHETAFTVSIDLLGEGCTTGISAYDRATGIRAMVNPNIKASDFARPGHIFPLKAKSGGVLRRTGHTEAAVDLARLSGFYPAGVLVEILNEDGTMARLPDLVKIAEKHHLKIVSIDDLVAYRMRTERIAKREITVTIDTKYGKFELSAYTQITTGDVHLAIKKGTWELNETVLVRVHSLSESEELLKKVTLQSDGDIFEKALERIAEAGKGLLLYMRHGEKDANFLSQLKSILNNKNGVADGKSEVKLDARDFGVGAQILRDFNISKMKLLTNHPKKRIGLIGYGLEIVENVLL